MADPDQVLASTDEKANFQRLTRLLISGGTRLLREIFDKYCPPSALPGKLRDPSIKRELMSKLTKPERDILYPSSGVNGKSTDCDVTLLFRLLRKHNICSLSPPPGGWDKQPASGDHTLTADLARIKYYRNSLYAHVKETMDIKDDEFHSISSEIRDAFVRIAGNLSSVKEKEWQAAIDKFLSRSSPLTAEDERNVEELKKWYLQDMEIKKTVKSIETVVREENTATRNLLEEVRQLMLARCLDVTAESGLAEVPRLGIHMKAFARSGPQVGATGNEESQHESQDMEIDNETTNAVKINDFLMYMAKSYVDAVKPSTVEGFERVLQYIRRFKGVLVADIQFGSLTIVVKCSSLQALHELWEDCRTGHLGEMVQKYLVTADTLSAFGVTEVKIMTSINEEEYRACEQHFLKLQDAGNTDVEYDITEPVRKRRKPDTTEDQGSSGSTETQDQGKHSVLSSKQSSKILQSFGRTSVAGKSPLSSRKEEGSATGEKGRQATIRSPRKERGKALDDAFDCQIVFALDYSWSVSEEEFEKEIDFVRHMNNSWNRENDIEAVVYGNDSETVSFSAAPGTFSDELQGLRNKAWRQSKGRRMDLALTKAAGCFTSSADEHLVILITVGRQLAEEESKEDDQDLVSATEALSCQSIKVILLPVGKETDFRELGLIVKRPQYLFPLSSFDDMTRQKASDIASYITKTVDLESYVKRRVQQFTVIPEKLSLWEKSSLCSDVLEGAWYGLYDNQAGTSKVKMLIRESIDNFQSTLVTESKVCITLAVFGTLGVGKSFFLNTLLNLGLKDEVKVKDGPLPSARGDSQTPLPIYVKFARNVQVLFYRREADPNPVEWFPEEEMSEDSLARVNNILLTRFQDKESLDSTSYVVLQGPFPVFTEMKTRTMTGEELHLELDVDVEFVDVPGLGADTGNEAVGCALSKADVILFFSSSQSSRPVSPHDISQVFQRREGEFKFVSRPKLVHIFNDKDNPCPPSLHEFDDLCKKKKESLDKAWSSFLSSIREDDGIYREATKKLPKLNSEDFLDKLSKESECIYFHAESTDFLTSLKSVVHNHVCDVKIKQTIHPFLQRVHWAAKILKKRVDTTTKKGDIVGIHEGQVSFEMLSGVYEAEESELITSFMKKALPLESDIKTLHEFLYSKFLLSSETRQFLAKVLEKSLKSYASRLINTFHNSNLGSLEDAPKDILQLTEIVCIARVEQFCANVAPTYLLDVLKKRKKQISLQKDDTLDWKPDACVESKSDLVERYLRLLLKKAAKSLEDDRYRTPKQVSRPPYFRLMKTLEELVVKLVPASSFEDACKTVFLNSVKDSLPKVIEFCTDTIRKINPHPKLDVRALPSLPEKMTNAKEDDKIPSQSSHDEIISEVTRLLLNPDQKKKKSNKKKDIISEMETKLKFKPGYLKRQQPQNADQRLWALGLVHVLSDKEHFDIPLPSEITLDPTADKAPLNVAREILFAHQKSSIFCNIVKTGDEQLHPDHEDVIHLKINAPQKCLEALVSSSMQNTLNAICAQFKDPTQQVAPIFIPITRPGPDIQGNYFLDEDPWLNSSPLHEESGEKDGEARGDSTQGNALKLNIFLVVEPNHLERLKSTIKDLRYPREHDVQLIYVVLPQKGRGIGVTRSVIKSLAECFKFSLYWTIDDNVQTMFRYVQDDHRWYKCPLTSGLLFGQRVFQGCLENSVKRLSDDEIERIFTSIEVWEDWAKHGKPGSMARKILYSEKSLSEVQRNRGLLHLPFADISEICKGDPDKEAKLKAYERKFVSTCKKVLFEDTINHISGVSLADVKSKGSDFMSRYPKADYMRSDTLSQVVLNNGDALKGKNFVSDEVILHDEELQIYDENKCNDPYWGIKGSETSFRRALLVSGVVGYRVIRIVYKCKKLRNAFDGESSERKAQRLGRSKDVNVNEDVDMGD